MHLLKLYLFLFLLPFWLTPITFGQFNYEKETGKEFRGIPKHVINFETGFFNRGMIGVFYTNNEVLVPNKSFISTFVGYGTRKPSFQPEFQNYFTLGLSYNQGEETNYFTYGLTLKYIYIYYWQDLDWVTSTGTFRGFTYGGFLGYTVYSKKLTFQIRTSYMRSFKDLYEGSPFYNLGNVKLSAIGIGASLGYVFFKD